MKKIGFFGVAVATTLTGDVSDVPSTGFEIVKGKSFDPAGGGTCAGGAGSGLVCGDHVIATGGVDGYDGLVGCDGVGADTVFDVLLPHPLEIKVKTVTATTTQTAETRRESPIAVANTNISFPTSCAEQQDQRL